MNKRGHNEVKQLTSDSKRNIAACTIPKEKLYCKHCDIKSLHNTSACLKKQKDDKERKNEVKMGKTEKEKLPTSRARKETSEERRKRDL